MNNQKRKTIYCVECGDHEGITYCDWCAQAMCVYCNIYNNLYEHVCDDCF